MRREEAKKRYMRVWRERRRHRKVKERKITFGHVHVCPDVR